MKRIWIVKTGLMLLFYATIFSRCSKTNSSISDYRLAVDAISPVSGGNNTVVTVRGKGFSLILTEDTVRFNGTPAETIRSTDTSMDVYAPAGGTTGTISVTVRDQEAGGPVFTYNVPAPVITGIVYNGLFAITGQHFDPQASVVRMGGQVVAGFNFTDLGAGQDQLVKQNFIPPSGLNNPAPITVTAGNVTSNIYSFLFAPVVSSVSPDTVYENATVTLQGMLFGDRTLTSNVRAFYFDQGNKTYMAPDPTVLSWNTNTIQISMPNYGSYPIGSGASVFYLEVNVGSRNGSATARFHSL